jgi:hypothetical protein
MTARASPIPSATARAALLATLLVWAVCAALMLASASGLIGSFTFRDSDDALRLQQVRDWMAGQGWFDVSQHRIFPPQGAPMHWSRLVDLPIAGAIWLARLFTDQAGAERFACIVVPLATLLALFLTIHAMVVEVTGRHAMAVAGAFMLLMSIGVAIQYLPMRIDHHGWQILLGALAALLALRAVERGPWQAALAGMAMALSLSTAIESLPFAVAIAGGFAWRFLRGRPLALLAAYLVSLTGSCALLLLATRGWAGALAPWCDALSPAYLNPMAAATASLLIADRLIGRGSNAVATGLRALGRPLLILVLAAVAGGLAIAIVAPSCLAGPFATLDPLVYRYWYQNVGEGMPVWRQTIDIAILVPLPGMLGLVGTLLALRHAPPARREAWLMLLVMQVVTFAVSLTVMRAMGLAHALAVPGTAWLFLTALEGALRHKRRPTRILLGFSCVALTPIGAEAVAYTLVVPTNAANEAELSRKWAIKFSCNTATALRGLDALGPTTIFAPLDIGPDIVIYTRNRVIATGHHRNRAGMRAVIAAFIADPGDARPIIARSGADYVAFCDGQREVSNYSKANPRGLIAQLRAGQVPGWLEPVAMGRGEAIKVYRLVR